MVNRCGCTCHPQKSVPSYASVILKFLAIRSLSLSFWCPVARLTYAGKIFLSSRNVKKWLRMNRNVRLFIERNRNVILRKRHLG
ncbi:MAG: hypothetical protein DMG64_16730, partial [Acidobacteria bacterium]